MCLNNEDSQFSIVFLSFHSHNQIPPFLIFYSQYYVFRKARQKVLSYYLT